MKERGHETYNRSLTSLNSPAGPIRQSQGLKRDKGLAEMSQGRPLYQPGNSTSLDATPSSSEVLRRCTRSNVENTLNRQNKDFQGLDSLPITSAQDPRHAQGNRTSCTQETERTHTKSETSTRQPVCDETDSRRAVKQSGNKRTSKEKDISEKSETKMDKNGSEKELREATKSSYGSGGGERQQHDDPVTLRRSGHSRSPSTQHASSSASDSSRSNVDTQSRKEEFRHKQERQSGHRAVSGSKSEKSSSEKSNRKTEQRGTREHHRKEERRQEGTSSSERRRTRSDGIKEYDHRNTQSEERNRPDENNSSRGERRCSRSEASKGHERQSAKDSGTTRGVGSKADKMHVNDGKDRSHTDVRENRRHASPVKPHHSAPTLRKDQDDKRRTSGRTEESSRSKASSSRSDSRADTCMTSFVHSVKEGIQGKGRSDKEKRIGTPDKGSKNAADNARIPKICENGNAQDDVANARQKSPISLTKSCNSSAVPEDSSPKRKLSFMETLNLTVSPIKKQDDSGQAKEPVQPPPEDTLVINSTKDRSSVEFGEEFCVIDEVEDDSMDDSLDVPNNVTAPPHDEEPPTSLELPKRFDGDLSETLSGKMDGTDSEKQEGGLKNSDVCPPSISQKCVVDKTVLPEVSLLPERAKAVDSACVSLTDVSCEEQEASQASVKKDKGKEMLGAKTANEGGQIDDNPQTLVQNDTSRQEVATSVMATAMAKTCSNMESSLSLEVVSSTVGVENNHQSEETIAVSDMEITGGLENPDPCTGPPVGASAEAINVNATTQEAGLPPGQASSSEPDSTENEMELSRPSRSVVVPHDEDSMMLTLNNIKVIPDMISPLTSPVRQIQKSQQQRLGKEPHVKSLSEGQFSVWVFL